jgi:hypothetical protein
MSSVSRVSVLEDMEFDEMDSNGFDGMDRTSQIFNQNHFVPRFVVHQFIYKLLGQH